MTVIKERNNKEIKRESIGCGTTIRLAQEQACEILGVDESDVDFEVIQLPEKKKFGIFGGKEAKVVARLKNEVSDYALYNLNLILQNLSKKPIDVKAEDDQKGTVFYLTGEGVSDLLDFKEDLIPSIQYIISLMSSQKNGNYYCIKINAEGLNDKREEHIKDLVNQAVEKVKETNQDFELERMNSYERRLVHSFIQDIEGFSSWSEGEGRDRHVIIGLTSKQN